MSAIYIGATSSDLRSVRAPNELRLSYSDLDAGSTSRTASGKMVRKVVRGGSKSIRKLELSWDLLREADAREILQLIQTTYFYMKYPDLLTGEMRTAQFYAGDKSIEFSRIERDGEVFIRNLSFNVIER